MMGWFSWGSDDAASARVDEALEAQDRRDARVQAHTDAKAAAYTKRHGLDGLVEKMTDDAMDRYRKDWGGR
jgi:hypothetical protein